MTIFRERQVREAMQHAAAGGQALHVWTPADPTTWPGAPACFRRAREWAHLFDQDERRLRATARRLGVRQIVVSDRGRPGQHVDLCGAPLRRAIVIAERPRDHQLELPGCTGSAPSVYAVGHLSPEEV